MINYRLSTKAMMVPYNLVILTEDIAGKNLKAGDVGVVVEVYAEGAGYEVEFLALNGDTIAVETLEAKQVRPATSNEILHVRTIEAA